MVSEDKKNKRSQRNSITVAFNSNDLIESDLYRYLSGVASMSGELKRLAYSMMLVEKMDQHRSLTTGSAPLFFHGQRLAEPPVRSPHNAAPNDRSPAVRQHKPKMVRGSMEEITPPAGAPLATPEPLPIQSLPSLEVSDKGIGAIVPVKSGSDVEIDDSGSFSLVIDPSRAGVQDEFDVDLIKM